MKPKLVTFDLDGTLINTLPDLAEAINATRKAFEKPPLEERTVMSFIGDGPRKFVERSFAGFPEISIDEAEEKYIEYFTEFSARNCRIIPGVIELLDFLDGIPLACVTNKLTRLAKDNLAKFDILDSFQLVLGFDYGIPPKPAPDQLLHACGEVGVDPHDAAHVGDGRPDVISAKAAGIPVFAFLGGFTEEKILRGLEPDYTINNMTELMEFWK